MLRFACILLNILMLLRPVYSAISCIGNDGKQVDWFLAYKLPRIQGNSNPCFRAGGGLMYMDNKSPNWTALDIPITSEGQPVQYTLQQIYDIVKTNNTEKKMYLMYNDDTPDRKKSSSKAHAKGSVCFDEKTGFWLIHSIPTFPPDSYTQNYSYPDSGTIYGQTLLCLTLPVGQLDLIGNQLQYINPQLYGSFISKYFEKASPIMWDFLAKGKRITKNDKVKNFSSVVKLESLGKKSLISFAKGRHFGKDLYSGLVAPTLKTGLLVESWLNGDGDFNSECSEYPIKNIMSLNMKGMKFRESQDHSKWAISDDSSGSAALKDLLKDLKYSGISTGTNVKEAKTSKRVKNVTRAYSRVKKKSKESIINTNDNPKWVCIGDINRQNSQTRRGGGTLCLDDANVWKEFRNLIVTIAECNGEEMNISIEFI